MTKADSESSEEEEQVSNGVINQNSSKKKNQAKQAKLRKEFQAAKLAAIEIDKFREARMKKLH